MSENIVEPTVIVTRQGRIGRLLLNRPRALNALDHPMITIIAEALASWGDDPGVHAVVIEGAGARAFCAGGDIKTVRADVLARRHDAIHSFFTDEYALNLAIAHYPKPYVALVGGICMGGGIGVSVHGSARVTTPAASFAMPETGIGLFPDIGASYVLPRLRGSFGMWMALTGARVAGEDAVWLGLATHLVAPERLAGLADAIAVDGVGVLAEAALPLSGSGLEEMAGPVARCFGAGSVAAILDALDAEDTDWAREQIRVLRSMSPSALCWTHALVTAGANRTLSACLEAELALTARVTRHPDFAEGVRAMVVDKDRTPRWSPERVEDVDPATIAALLAP